MLQRIIILFPEIELTGIFEVDTEDDNNTENY